MICEQPFQRFNLARFPCHLKRLQASYEKLIEICLITPGMCMMNSFIRMENFENLSVDDDDEKWWSKLNACKWLKYISKALHGAVSLAKLLNFRNIQLAGKNVLH